MSIRKPWFRRILVVLALALPATAYAANRLNAASSCASCPMGDCGMGSACPYCAHHTAR
jgi:hypothetical protein